MLMQYYSSMITVHIRYHFYITSTLLASCFHLITPLLWHYKQAVIGGATHSWLDKFEW